MAIKRILLIHHSHTDLGYTHDQPVVADLHRRFIDRAITFAEAHPEHGPATFRWTCEVTWGVENWLRHASSADVERFVKLAKRGQIEVAALWANLTPLYSLDRLQEMLAPVQRLRQELGLEINVAMNSDVNGVQWALTDALLDAGIPNMSMAINEHFGNAPEPRPGAFRWQTPSGRELMVWNGFTYAHAGWLHISEDLNEARQNILKFAAHLQQRGYPHELIILQLTHAGPQNDNIGPIPWISDWLTAFNTTTQQQDDGLPLLELTTPTMAFRELWALDPATLPVHRGDWRDWWNFGCASTPRATTEARRAQIRLRDADAIASFLPAARAPHARAAAGLGIDLFNEHTWGADCAVHHPGDPDTFAQAIFKDETACRARANTMLYRREALAELAAAIDAPQRPGVMVFNPAPIPQRRAVRVAQRLLNACDVPSHPGAGQAWPDDPAYRHFADRHLWSQHETVEIGPFDLPPLSWTLATADHQRSDAPGAANETEIKAGDIALRWNPDAAGITSLTALGREWIQPQSPSAAAVLHEKIDGERASIFAFDDAQLPIWTRIPHWNEDVPLTRTLSTFIEQSTNAGPGFAESTAVLNLPDTVKVTQHTRIETDEPRIDFDYTIEKQPQTQPHALYLMLPFELATSQKLYESAGVAIDPDREHIPGDAPWLSFQNALAIGDQEHTAYIVSPDAALAQFNRFPIGHSRIGDHDAATPGLCLLWLYNNYWETNFRADDAGIQRFHVSLYFRPGPPDAVELMKLAATASRAFEIQPLATPDPKAFLPPEGQLLSIAAGPVVLHHLRPVDNDEHAAIATLVNPTNTAQTSQLGSALARISSAYQADIFGNAQEPLPLQDDRVRVNVPARGVARVRLNLEFTAAS